MIKVNEKKKDWSLNSWWQKSIYCVGWFYVILWALSFLIGFVAGVLSAL
jgi:hypothetical protein